jgi:hypothetical protein
MIMEKVKAFFRRLWAMCLRSATIAWSYVLGAAGAVMNYIDQLAALFNDTTFGAQVQTVLGDPKAIGKWLMVVAGINIATRVRSMVFKPAPKE